MEFDFKWLVHPFAIAFYISAVGVLIKLWLVNADTSKYTWIKAHGSFLKQFSFIGEALVIVGLVEGFIGIKFIKDAVLEGVRETLIDYKFIDNLSDEAHRKLLTRIIAKKFELSESDAVVTFYSKEISDSLISPRFIQDKKITYTVSLAKDSKEINLVHTIDKTVFLGGHASHKYETAYPGVYDYTLRLNGKDCVKFNLDSNKNSKPPNGITKTIGEITCQFTSTPDSQPTTYRYINNISTTNVGEKAGFYLKQSARIKDAKLTGFVALAERIKNVEVTVNYPNEVCKFAIQGYEGFEQEAKKAQKEHDSNKGHEFHHMFEGEYGPESILYFAVDCS